MEMRQVTYKPLDTLIAPDPVVVAVWTPKGGTGKTIVAYTIARSLAESENRRVLLVDANCQCDLIPQLLGDNDDMSDTDTGEHTLYGLLEPVFTANTMHSGPLRLPSTAYPSGGELTLLPGHYDVIDWDARIVMAEATLAAFPTNRNIPGAPMASIRLLGRQLAVDVVVIDMNANANALNRYLWWGADHHVMPILIDYFSLRAVERLHSRFLQWEYLIRTHLPYVSTARVTPVASARQCSAPVLILNQYQVDHSNWAQKIRSAVIDQGVLPGAHLMVPSIVELTATNRDIFGHQMEEIMKQLSARWFKTDH